MNALIDFRAIIALPNELNREQTIELVRDFIERTYTATGRTVSYAVAWDEENPHLHLQGPTRQLTEDGVGSRLKEFSKYGERVPRLTADRQSEIGR